MKHLLAGASLFALAACTSSSTVTPAQVASDLTGVVNALSTIVPQIEKAAPNALNASQQAQLANDLTNAKSALQTFAAGIPATTGASKAQVIDGYINDILSAVGAVAPPPYSTAIVAAEVVVPEVEAFVNQYLPVSWTTAVVNALTPTPAPAVTATAPGMSLSTARATLGIPTIR